MKEIERTALTFPCARDGLCVCNTRSPSAMPLICMVQHIEERILREEENVTYQSLSINSFVLLDMLEGVSFLHPYTDHTSDICVSYILKHKACDAHEWIRTIMKNNAY